MTRIQDQRYRGADLLILGAPRSGTTLLSAMLSCHSEIAILSENLDGSAGKILSKRYGGVKLCIPNQIELDRRGTRLGRLLKSRTLPKLLRRLQNWPSSRLSIRDYQKNPDLQIVAIIRHPDDMISSVQRRAGWSSGVAEQIWVRSIEILATLHREGRSPLTLVTYNSLVTDPERVMKHVLAELGLDFQERVLEGYRHTPQYTGREQIDPSKARGPAAEVASSPALRDVPGFREKVQELYRIAV